MSTLCKGERKIKIYSKKIDYYDGIQFYGQDNSVIYKRKTIVKKSGSPVYKKIIENNTVNKLIDTFSNIEIENANISLVAQLIIFFCGRPYPCFIYTSEDKEQIKTRHYCYSIEDIEKIIDIYGSRDQILEWNNKKIKWVWRKIKDKKYSEKIFHLSKHLEYNQRIYELHHELEVPVFIYAEMRRDNRIILNPILKKYKFFKMIDAYTAFQEISMFISGVIGNLTPPIIEVSNNIKIAKHGYDKYSFRKEPWKRR